MAVDTLSVVGEVWVVDRRLLERGLSALNVGSLDLVQEVRTVPLILELLGVAAGPL